MKRKENDYFSILNLTCKWLTSPSFDYFQFFNFLFQTFGTSRDAKNCRSQFEHREQHPNAFDLRKHNPLSLLIFRRQGRLKK